MGALEKIRAQAAKDAKRYSMAQMNYGTGAGNRRKIVSADIKDKLEDPVYKEAFYKALDEISDSDVARRIERRKNAEKAYNGAKKAYRGVKKAGYFYQRNRGWIDQILHSLFD